MKYDVALCRKEASPLATEDGRPDRAVKDYAANPLPGARP